MNIWLTTDTHFGHKNIIKYCGRPQNHEALMLGNLYDAIKPDDMLIHLGDVALGHQEFWHPTLTSIDCKRKWLVLGNHDRKSFSWYIKKGWDFVGSSISLDMYGKTILLSHKPIDVFTEDFNIHGHVHNTPWICKEGQILLMQEHTYAPVTLRSLVE